MRATKKMLLEHITILMNKGGTSVLEKGETRGKRKKKEFPDVQDRKIRKRGKDVLVSKMKTNKKLSNKEEEMLGSEHDSHM